MKFASHLICFLYISLQVAAHAPIRKDSSFSYPKLDIGTGGGFAAANGICQPSNENEIIPGYSFITMVGVILNKKISVEATVQTMISAEGDKDTNNLMLNLLASMHY